MRSLSTVLVAGSLLLSSQAFAQDTKYPIHPEIIDKFFSRDGDLEEKRKIFDGALEKVGALEDETTRRYGKKPSEMGVVNDAYVRKNGDVVEVTTRYVPVAIETFVKAVPPQKWGPNLADYIGGEIELFSVPGGTGLGPASKEVVRQIERMVLESPGKNLDMTKVEVIEWEYEEGAPSWEFYGPSQQLKKVRISWEVIFSDDGSVVRDVGYIEFARAGKDRTRVTSHSAHKLGIFPKSKWYFPKCVEDAVVKEQLKCYFKKVGAKYSRLAKKYEREKKRAVFAKRIARSVAKLGKKLTEVKTKVRQGIVDRLEEN